MDDRIKMPTTHRSPPTDANTLQAQRIFIAKPMRGEGEADDVFALNGNDAAAMAALFVERQFERGGDVECVELAAGSVEERFGFGEFFDGDDARIEGGGGQERAGGGDAEADGVAGDVEA